MRAALLGYRLFSMISLALALTACLGWGVADFLGGLKSRALSAITVLLATLVLHEKPARIQLLGVALAMAGVALISSG